MMRWYAKYFGIGDLDVAEAPYVDGSDLMDEQRRYRGAEAWITGRCVERTYMAIAQSEHDGVWWMELKQPWGSLWFWEV